jgi:hypothetical protein
MNSTEWIKRIFIVCISFMLVYLIIINNYVSLNNLPKIYPKLNVIIGQANVIQESSSKAKISKCDIIHKDYKQYSHKFDGIAYPQYLYLSQNYSINFDCLNNSSPMKLILAWTKFYGTENFGYGLGKVQPFVEHNCPVTNCELTRDKNRVNESDFVLVWLTDSIEKEIPVYRPGKQRWVGGVIESPVHTPSYTQYNGVFNMTADYQIESEFGINYESQKRFLWGLNTTFNDSHDYSQGKTGFMTALISNCNAWHNKRMDYINNLRKYVSVVIYGACGEKCPPNVDCREYVGAKYKFYFAFENSNCKDYITEKFFMMLKYDIVMVVFGAGNYSRYVRNFRNSLN